MLERHRDREIPEPPMTLALPTRPPVLDVSRADPVPLCIASEAVSLCHCGGDLGHLLGSDVHVDTCADCRETPGRCEYPGQHKACDFPEPVQCEHMQCHAANDLQNYPCATDRRHCCGCCHNDY